MVDYTSLKKKFPNRDATKKERKKKIKAISVEFKAKRAELAMSAPPLMKKGLVFYAVIIAGLAILGSLILSASGKGGRKFISKAKIDSEKSVNALAVALGRYRYHTGFYPTTREGLQQLAAILPHVKGWNGPYIRRVVKDPWGNDYVYVCKGQTEDPSLFSKGPDGLEGTADDILPEKDAFDRPFRDLSWLEGWMPHNLRGYVLVKDDTEKKSVSNIVESHRHDYSDRLKNRRIDFTLKEIAEMCSFGPRLFTDWFSAWPAKTDGVRFLTPFTAAAEGDEVVVRCTSDADEAELFAGKKSYGRKKKSDGVFEWKVSFVFDKLNVISFRGGSPVSSAELYPNSAPAALRLSSPAAAIPETGFALIALEAVDKRGNVVEAEKLAFEVSVEGPARIVARSDGGSLVEYGGERTGNAAGFRGPRMFFVVQRLPGSGRSIVFTARSGGLLPAKITFGRSL